MKTQDESTEQDRAKSQRQEHGFLERQARRVARWPRTHLWPALFLAMVISVLGMWGGDFRIGFETIGFGSRGTLIADRQSQFMLVDHNKECLSQADNEDCWKDLTTNVQAGWEIQSRIEVDSDVAVESSSQKRQAVATSPTPTNVIDLLEQCDVNTYSQPDFFVEKKLWPVWKVADDSDSAMDPPLLQELCEAEKEVQAMLYEEGLCYGCNNGQCLPPLSIVLYARIKVGNGLELNCKELAEAWAPYQAEEEDEWKACVEHQRIVPDFRQDRGPCSTFFSPSMVDSRFYQTGRVAYTSSIFVTNSTAGKDKQIYNLSHKFPRGNSQISGAYDNQMNSFREFYATEAAPRDGLLVAGSILVTTSAMLAHTGSPFLTLIAVLQIGLSFPLAFTIYRFIGGIAWFPFLNLIGLFVGFALGADHVFVAVDKWKIQRNDNSNASTEDIAGRALPGAGRAMVLTTITTSVAFLGLVLALSCPSSCLPSLWGC